jgi:rubrerythrin
MAFQDPFPGLKKPLDRQDLIRAMRLDLAAEQEAIATYSAHADATSDLLAKKVLTSIINEERTHAGEFLRLIQLFTNDEPDFQIKGYEEVDKILEALSPLEARQLAHMMK